MAKPTICPSTDVASRPKHRSSSLCSSERIMKPVYLARSDEPAGSFAENRRLRKRAHSRTQWPPPRTPQWTILSKPFLYQ